MNRNVYAIASDITSGLGFGVESHWRAVSEGKQGIKEYRDDLYSAEPFYGSMLSEEQWGQINNGTTELQDLTSFERLCIYSAKSAINKAEIDLDKTMLLLSTTKGNIELLNVDPDNTISLFRSAKVVAGALGIKSKPTVVSHACISGAAALLYAQTLIQGNRCEHVIVIGCDRFTPFVLNGFQSFQAIANGPCRPFDKGRKGINLGEAAATIILSSKPGKVQLMAGATSNDANHISGPSRTGEELSDAINRALSMADISADDIDIISAHGTATLYNDEMEAKALNISKLSTVPVHSMKSYTGHTLGAAGVLESAMLIESFKRQQLIPSAGYTDHGVTVPLNVTKKVEAADIKYALKTASGFGGCNAALIWAKA